MRLTTLTICCIVLASCINIGESANILGVFTSNSKSHLIIHMSIARALVDQGHNVTVLTTLPLNDKSPGYRHILLPLTNIDEMNEQKKKMVKKESGIMDMFETFNIMIGLQKNAIQSKEYLDFIKEDNKFDLVILGYFFNDFQIGIAAHFKCPIVFSWMSNTFAIINELIGNPAELAYVPHQFFSFPSTELMNFKNRVFNFLASGLDVFFRFILNTVMQSIYSEVFPADKYPSYKEMQKNVSVIMCNHHFSEGPIRPNVPGLVEVGGIQIKDTPDPLPKDLEDFMKSGKKDGVVFFSLGSNARSADLKEDTIKKVFNVLSSLKQKVVWKWEDEKVPGKSSNILFGKWLPQDDILAHPNTKLFITHGGKGSIAESQYHGVPMVGLPIFGDQTTNVKKLAELEYGVEVDYNRMTEESFRQSVMDVLENPKYSNNVKTFAKLYRDRPLTAKQNAVFWIEYVIRHHGAPHMQSPLVHLNWLQSTSLDVIIFLIVIIYVVCKIIKITTCFLWSKLCKKNSKKSTKTKKSKSE